MMCQKKDSSKGTTGENETAGTSAAKEVTTRRARTPDLGHAGTEAWRVARRPIVPPAARDFGAALAAQTEDTNLAMTCCELAGVGRPAFAGDVRTALRFINDLAGQCTGMLGEGRADIDEEGLTEKSSVRIAASLTDMRAVLVTMIAATDGLLDTLGGPEYSTGISEPCAPVPPAPAPRPLSVSLVRQWEELATALENEAVRTGESDPALFALEIRRGLSTGKTWLLSSAVAKLAEYSGEYIQDRAGNASGADSVRATAQQVQEATNLLHETVCEVLPTAAEVSQ